MTKQIDAFSPTGLSYVFPGGEVLKLCVHLTLVGTTSKAGHDAARDLTIFTAMHFPECIPRMPTIYLHIIRILYGYVALQITGSHRGSC